jgi:hypothetical protein
MFNRHPRVLAALAVAGLACMLGCGLGVVVAATAVAATHPGAGWTAQAAPAIGPDAQAAPAAGRASSPAGPAVQASAPAVGRARLVAVRDAGPAPGRRRPAATPACGPTCANYFVQEFGRRFVLNAYRGHEAPGTKILLYRPSNANRDEDWTIWPTGTVAQLAAFGLVSRALALHYGTDNAFEVQYAPYGVGSGMCAGVARPASNGEAVTLQWCGRSARTIWVLDAADASGAYAPLINGSDTNFSDPQVLTEPGWPRSVPRPGLVTRRLQEFSDGTVYDDQSWNNTVGVLP